MAENPLQKYFRQPKIYVGLPSKGIYNKLGSVQGDVTNMPVYSMTGMDEIMMKTPDALMSGESTVAVIQSCCPYIKDAWELSALDTDLIFTAIRIATFGNKMEVTHTCPNCSTENEYEIDLGKFIEHYNRFDFNNSIVSGDLTIKLQPLTYRESTDISIKNFALQRQIAQSDNIENEEEQKQVISKIFKELGMLQNEIFTLSIESVETPEITVTDKSYIKEWLTQCDKEVFSNIKSQFDAARKALVLPPQSVICSECQAENLLSMNLDQSSFFGNA
jgi:hypothetical protein